MRFEKIKLPVFCLIAFLFFSACTKDEDIVDTTGEEPTSGESVAALDHTVLYDWTEQMLAVERYATGMRPNASARAFAYIYLAAYETAAPGMLDHQSAEDLLRDFNIRNSELPEEIDWELALNSALAEVMDHFMLNISDDLRSQIAEFAAEKEAAYSEGLSAELIADSQEWGAYVAERVIRYSESDRQAEQQILEPQPLSYEPPTGLGFWTYSADPERALFPYWESVRTFVISPDETSTVAPIAYSEQQGSPYFAQMLEVYNVNNEARAADGEQLWIAEFWSDDVEGLMFSPPARQYAIANQLLRQYDLDLEQALVLYLKLGFSLNDAAVATWKYKYEYMVMRPNLYIHELIDPDYQTNLYRLVYWPNPSFPGYPSGHSCFASAAGGVFIDFFGDATNFTDRSHEGRTEFRGTPRQFSSFSDMAAENAYSRIPLGVHIRMDCDEGLRLGYEISDAINGLDLRKDPG
ncbi:MAG: vanadium-dependent haloperoxidase [Bacteroidota bacterium]